MQGSSGKSLSNGTLGLRFMQNALRAKQQAAVESERAKVKDDAEWEVSQEVREAWGLASSSRSEDENRIHCETSYLPFLFSSERDADESSNAEDAENHYQSLSLNKPSGRRSFNHGREVITVKPDPAEEEKPKEIPIPPKAIQKARAEKEPRSGKGSHDGRPGSLSTAKSSSKIRTDPISQLKEMHSNTRLRNAANHTSVRRMISEQTTDNVGVDLPISRVSKDFGTNSACDKSTKSSMNFLRPAGVDNPVVSSSNTSKRSIDDSMFEETDHNRQSTNIATQSDDVDRKQEKKKKQKQEKAPSDN